MNKKLVLLLSLIVLAAVSAPEAGTIVVRPGKFNHFTLEVPDRTVAGESFVIKATAYDLHNNLITNFAEYGKEFKIQVSGSATVQPSHLSSASFRGGIAHVSVMNKRAERVVFSIYPEDGTIPLISREIPIEPNKLDHFTVLTPPQVTAGNSFEVKIIAKDIFDNTVTDKEMAGKNIKLASSGTTSVSPVGAAVPDFRNGIAAVSLMGEKTGRVSVEIQDSVSGSKGRSQDVLITPAALGQFKIHASPEAVAGEPFEITISVFDIYGNSHTDYASLGGGVNLRSTGDSKVDPAFVKAAEFKNGEANLKVVYEKAEEITLVAKEQNSSQAGKSNTVKVRAAVIDHFVVITPEDAMSGQPFKIKVEAYDRFNNRVRNFNVAGHEVYLKTTGTGALTPSSISPAEFVDGVAAVDVVYDKAESFALSAYTTPGRVAEKTVKAPKPKPEEHAMKPEMPEKAEKVEKPKEPEQPKPTEKKEERKAEPAKEAKVPVKEAKRGEPRVEPKKEPKKEAKLEEPKKEVKKEKQPTNISNISLIEAKEKAMLIINVMPPDGTFEYKEKIESRQGKEWLKIGVKPVLRTTEKSMKFMSEFVGNILVEEDPSEQGLVNVFVELVPEKVTFDITKLKNSLIVTVSKP